MRPLLAAALIALAVPAAMALGLGPLELRSRLGQPLEAIVPVHGVAPREASLVSAFVPDPADFERLGAKRTVVTRLLRLETVSDGDAIAIRATTLQPIREPALDLVIEVAYRHSRLVQRFRVSFDDGAPPGVEPTAATTPATGAAAGRYGPVKGTDTLWSLARRLRPAPGITIEQMMVALVQANPGAFAARRFDGLRRGSYLVVPRPDAVLRTAPDAARRLVARGALPAP